VTLSWSQLLPSAAGVLALAGLVLLLWALRGDPSRGRRRCGGCWYDLSGAPAALPVTCPECGRMATSERQFLAARRRWRWAFAALCFMILPWALLHTPGARARGWPALVPTTALIAFATDLERPINNEPSRIARGDIRGIPARRRLCYELNLRLTTGKIAGWQIDWLSGQFVTNSSWDGDGRREPGPLTWLGRWAIDDETRGGTTGTRLLRRLRDRLATSTLVTRPRWPRHTPIAVGLQPCYWHGQTGALVVTPLSGTGEPLTFPLASPDDQGWFRGGHTSALEPWRDDKLVVGSPTDESGLLELQLELVAETTSSDGSLSCTPALWRASIPRRIELTDTVDDVIQPITSEAIASHLESSLVTYWHGSFLVGASIALPAALVNPETSVAVRLELLRDDVVIASASARVAAERNSLAMPVVVFPVTDASSSLYVPDLSNPAWQLRVTADPELALHDFQATHYWSGSFKVPLFTISQSAVPIH
jgi:hypothetical protein